MPVESESPADTDARLAAYDEVAGLAEWSPWVPWAEADGAPRSPGVFLLRDAAGVVRHVGWAGERAGAGRAQGVRGRLRSLTGGHEPATGLLETVLDRALADPVWRSAERDPRARQWAAEALAHWAPDVCWAATPEAGDARHLATQVTLALRAYGLWVR